jgi:bifunctional non-homologous end joining protein LigD
MPRIVKRSASQAVKAASSRRSRPNSPLPPFVPPQLCQPVDKPPSGPQWVHEIKLDGYRMAARIDNGRVQLLTRTGLDWTNKYPGAAAALANLNVKTAYVDGELCGVDEAGLPSFAQTQAATDGERGVHLVYYAFDLLHLGGWDISGLSLIERKALLEPLVTNKPGLQFNGHDTGDGELILQHAGKLGFEDSDSGQQASSACKGLAASRFNRSWPRPRCNSASNVRWPVRSHVASAASRMPRARSVSPARASASARILSANPSEVRTF